MNATTCIMPNPFLKMDATTCIVPFGKQNTFHASCIVPNRFRVMYNTTCSWLILKIQELFPVLTSLVALIQLNNERMEIMNLVEKRDFIHSHLHQVNESLINQFYDTLRKEEALKTKLIGRAEKSENDIHAGKVFSRAEIEQKTNDILR